MRELNAVKLSLLAILSTIDLHAHPWCEKHHLVFARWYIHRAEIIGASVRNTASAAGNLAVANYDQNSAKGKRTW